MFETAELGRQVPKKIYKDEVPRLQQQLLETQRILRSRNIPVIVIVAGVEGAGKGEVVNLLNQWLDPRGLETHAFWDQSDEERARPEHWRFWRRLPARGRIALMFGSWYTQPIVGRAYDEISEDTFENRLHHINILERMLTDDGYLLVKLWFHLSRAEQKRRAKAQKKPNEALHLSPYLSKFGKNYARFVEVSERAIRSTDNGHAPWNVMESADWRYRNLATGQILLRAMQQHLSANQSQAAPIDEPPTVESPEPTHTILDHVELTQALTKKEYETQLLESQRELNQLVWSNWQQKRLVVLVFEGWDAAGKGGVIRRVTASIDARLTEVVPVGTPTDDEQAHHYLWRFWRSLPQDGKLIIFDRSWYGRVLVERVEGYAKRREWSRAYREIHEFEEQLVDHGAIIEKFWLHISQEEQHRRFLDREQTPTKQHKITAEDWRNREKWEEYRTAVNEMVARTNTKNARWHLVPSEDKYFARIFVLKQLCETLRSASK